MVGVKDVERQLKQIGCNFKFWGRPEIIELSKILMPDEKIAQCVNGTYEGGFALLCATDQRVLLVDKKPMYLTIEDIRFDMISDLNFSRRLLDSTLQIMTGVKTLQFTAYSPHRLRLIMSHIQQRVTELRHRRTETERAQMKVAEEIEEELQHRTHQPQQSYQQAPPLREHQQQQPALQRMATDHMNNNDSFDGFRHQVALQIARYIGPRAVVFSQLPPGLSRYKLPLPRRPYRT
ncbi:MAG: hypothetical protein JWM37_145 [Candidatus Saccharibacteria bacterium]|nr:hypothetical protein [Candidatus Saccharibacteria bacterium]